MTAIGELRTRLTLQAPQETPDGAGGVARTWLDVASVWSKLVTPRGGESFAFGRIDAELSHKVILRYRGDVTPDMRFEFGARVLDIRAVFDPDGRRRWLHCLCAEREA